MATMSLARIRGELDSMRARHKTHIDKAKRGGVLIGNALVTSSSAALCGYLQGRTNGKKLFDVVPIELALAGAFGAAAMFGPKGGQHQFTNLTNGAIAAYATALARGFGIQARAKAGGAPLMKGLSDGLDDVLGPVEGGGTLSTDDLVRMAEQV